MLKGILCKGWLGIFETQVIGNSRVKMLQCFEWVELGNSIMLGYWLLCPISRKICGRICGLEEFG
jgi:hypothetical protein